jgi:threonyl-tRNA synthetase
MIINRSLRFSTSTFTRQLRFNKLPQPTLHRLNYQVMSVANTPHPVSSSSEPPKAAVGPEPVTPGASATPAPASAPAAEAKDRGKGKEAKQPKPKKEKAEGAPNGAADSAKPKKEKPAPSGPLELSPPPGYFDERIKIFDEYKAKYDAEVAGKLALAIPV